MADVSDRPNPWPTLGKLFLALLAAGVLAAGLAMPAVLGSGLVGKHYASQFLNTTCNLQETKPPEPTTLYASDNKTRIARLFTQDRNPVPLSDVPTYLQDALIATEDRRFYSHHGVDLRGLIRSAVSTSSGDTQGGSTLTMQYVKQIRYYQAGDDPKKQQDAIAQTLTRKMEDARCALAIEGKRHESKHQILDNYLNIAFFGQHAYGIERAAKTYFGVEPNKLSLDQAALLVGLLRAPSAYDPFNNPEAAKQRRNEVIQNLVNDGKLSQDVANKYEAKPISLATTKPPVVREGCASADSSVPNVAFFCEYAVNWLLNTQKLTSSQLQTGGLRIVTTLDPKLQTSMQQHLAKTIPASSPMTAVLPAIDPKTGNVQAMAASKQYGSGKNETEQPIFTSDTAFGASTFKLFPLLSALQTGFDPNWNVYTEGNTGNYHSKNCATPARVHNGDENVQYDKNETLTTAMAKSSNTFFVALADQGFDCLLTPTIQLMQKMGMTGLKLPSDTKNQDWAQIIEGKQRAQQLVLGSVPTSAMELTGAYATVANGGKFNAPAPILSIKTNKNKYVPLKRTPEVPVLSAQAAHQAAQILIQESKSGGAAAGRFTDWYGNGGSDIAGKTGTNVASKQSENSSIWYVGMTPHLVAASGLVNFDLSSAPSQGLPHERTGKAYGDYAAMVWLKSVGPSVQSQHWDWDTWNQPTGNDVPDVVGQDLSQATRTLKQAGYNVSLLGGKQGGVVSCASDAPYSSIGYYGPTVAPTGATITVCQSSGVGPQQPPPPPAPPKKKKKTGGGGSGGGSGGGNGHGHGGPTHHPGARLTGD